MATDKQALLEAVQQLVEAIQQLVEADDAHEQVSIMETVAHLARRYPVRLDGRYALLHELMRLMNADPDAYARIKQLINEKRIARGQPPAWPEPEPPKFDKVVYQLELMAQRRLRSGRAVEIENMLRSERDRLMGNTRLEFERHQLAVWGKQLKDKLASLKASQGTIPREQQDAIRHKFWSQVDAELDEREAHARQEMLKPSHQRRKV